MARTFRTIIANPAALLALAALAACGGGAGGGNAGGSANGAADTPTPPAGQLFADNFKGVCSGATVSGATAYNAQGRAHKALFFETYKDGLADRSTSLPDDWTVQYSTQGDAYRAVDLVVCARRTADRQVKVCDGYKNREEQPTQNRVNWHSATYELTLREATTGRQLAQSTVEANDASCPMLQMFENDTEVVEGYASPSDTAVADFLRPHIAR